MFINEELQSLKNNNYKVRKSLQNVFWLELPKWLSKGLQTLLNYPN